MTFGVSSRSAVEGQRTAHLHSAKLGLNNTGGWLFAETIVTVNGVVCCGVKRRRRR